MTMLELGASADDRDFCFLQHHYALKDSRDACLLYEMVHLCDGSKVSSYISPSAVLLPWNPASFQVVRQTEWLKAKARTSVSGRVGLLAFPGHYERFQMYTKEVTSCHIDDVGVTRVSEVKIGRYR